MMLDTFIYSNIYDCESKNNGNNKLIKIKDQPFMYSVF